MSNFKEGLKCAKKVARTSLRILGPVAVFVLFNYEKIGKLVTDIKHDVNATYDDVFTAINDSGMLSKVKCELLSLVKVDQDSDYYRTVLKTLYGRGSGRNKIKMIEVINSNLGK